MLVKPLALVTSMILLTAIADRRRRTDTRDAAL